MLKFQCRQPNRTKMARTSNLALLLGHPIFLPSTSCCSSSASIDAWHCAVRCHWQMVVLQPFISKANYCYIGGARPGLATLSIKNLWWRVCDAHISVCRLVFSWRSRMSDAFFLWDSLNKDMHSELLLFQYSSCHLLLFHCTTVVSASVTTTQFVMKCCCSPAPL
jgi:hypothetical protein